MNCIPCGKTFTGQICYQQHLHSEKHKKKAKLELTETLKSDDVLNLPSVAERISCDVCNISFETLQNYKKHVESLDHAQNMVKRIANKNNSKKEMLFLSEASVSSNDIDANLIEMKDDDRIINMQECVNQKLYYKDCDICNKKFSGPEPYQQHLVSIGHRKKLALNSNSNTAGVSDTGFITSAVATVPSVGTKILICEVCDKTFSGPVPHFMHLNSDVHKRKIKNKALLEQYRNNSINENSMNVDVIDSTSNEGENHPRGEEYNNSKIISKIDTTNSSNDFDELPEKNSDSILFDHTNLDIITADQLGVTFVTADSEINFDKQIKSDVLPYESNEVDENEMPTEIQIAKKCLLCNVLLKDMDDLTKHYESREHFFKKWGDLKNVK